jgi:hypothetical protein
MERRPLRDPPPPSQPLEQRIADALGDNAIKSAVLAALYNEVAAAITAAATAADHAKERALNPSTQDAQAARARRDDCVFQLERLKAALPPLQQRYSQVRLAERRTEWREQFAQVKAKRDATAEKLQAIYELTEQLIEVLQEGQQVDQEVEIVNSTAPNGEPDRLLTTECAARGVNGVGPNGALSLMTDLKLPRWNAPGLAWPPPEPAIDFQRIVPPNMLTHPGDNWAAHQQEAKAQADAEAKRVAEFYRRQTREREERDNAEAKAAQERRRQASTT